MQKDLANANISETKSLWCELLSDASIGVHFSSSATWSWCNCYFEFVSSAPFKEYVIWYMGKILKKTTKLLAWMWLSLFDALFFILLACWYFLILKSKGKADSYRNGSTCGRQAGSLSAGTGKQSERNTGLYKTCTCNVLLWLDPSGGSA